VNITFPTRPGDTRSAPGAPTRARACRCDCGAFLAQPEDTCLRCGHYDAATIHETWRQRALTIAQQRRREPANQLARAA